MQRLAQEHLGALEETVAPVAQRAADRLAGGEGALRGVLGDGSSGATLFGSARVVDGDTLEVRGTRIRLHGSGAAR